MNNRRQHRVRRAPQARRAVILLVMLGMLALFTLIAVTFVVASGQFRRGATAAAAAERTGDPFDTLLQQALMQVARGSNHPQSAIGPHSLLEDMYGNGDAVAGCCYIDGSQLGAAPPLQIYSRPSGSPSLTSRTSRTQPFKGSTSPAAPMLIEIGAMSFGWDREPGIALVDDNSNGIVDDVAEVPDLADGAIMGDDCLLGSTYAHPAMVGEPPSNWASTWQNKSMSDGSGPLPIIDNIDNYYAGRVITFVNGDAAGQSSYIVRSKLVPVNATLTTPNPMTNGYRTVLYIQPFLNGSQPSHKDRFVINGRAFNGAGFGYNPYVNNSGTLAKKQAYIGGAPNPSLRQLDMPYSEPFINTPAVGGAPYSFDQLRAAQVPIALLPNPIDGGYRDYLNRYNSIVDADEDYDAPDEQNMLLSYSIWVPPLEASNQGRYKTIMPSLHRPDLVKFFTNRYGAAVASSFGFTYPRWHDVPPYIRRRYILRPDPSDHYDWTQEFGAVTSQNSDGWTPGEPFQDINNNGQWDPATIRGGGPGGPEDFTDLPNPRKNNYYDIGDRAYYNTGFDAMDGPWDVDNDNDNLPDSIWVDLGAPVTTAPDGRIVKPMFAVLVRDLDGRINVNAHGSPKHYDRLPPAYSSGYSPGTAPGQYQTEDRVRIGNYAWAMFQLKPSVDWNTVDVMRVHTGGDADPTRDGMTFRDIPFQGVWALPYNNDGPFFDYSAPYPRTGSSSKASYYDILKPSQTSLILSAIPDANADRIPDLPWYDDGGQRKPVWQVATANTGGPRPLMFDVRGAGNASGTAIDPARYIRGFEPAVGQGYSVADINIGPVLHSGIWGLAQLPNSNTTNTASTPSTYERYNYYRVLLEGRPDVDGTKVPTSGRYGESYLLRPLKMKYPGIDAPRAGVTDSLVLFSHLLNEPSTASTLPQVSQMAPQRGDDNYPAPPTRTYPPSDDMRFVRGNAHRDSFMPVTNGIIDYNYPTFALRNYGVTVPNPSHKLYSPSVFGAIIGDYGTPGDIDGDGAVALDARGQPVFLKMGTANEEIDDPTEINLHRRYFAQTYFGTVSPDGGLTPATVSLNAAGVPLTTDIDAPYSPAELERLLRARDAGAAVLPTRLRDNLRGDGEGGEVDNYDLRRAITSESWDVPCPHVAPTPELAAAMRALNLPINNPSIVDLLRARFYLATGQAPSAALALKAARLSTIAMRSYKWRTSPADVTGITSYNTASPELQGQFPTPSVLAQVARRRWHTRLLSPDLGLGLRMDINAPFGNGYDEDPDTAQGDGVYQQGDGIYQPTDAYLVDPNGVVDEPREFVKGNVFNGSIYETFLFDGNRDGNYAATLDEEARQQFAKELYCLMMLLIDQNYVEPLPTSVAATSTASGAVTTSTYAAGAEATVTMNGAVASQIYPYISNPADKVRRWLTARRMAQWAINVVDFRDRDAIMTPFEFDADPFFDNDNDTGGTGTAAQIQPHLPTSNGTWDVDGYLLPDNFFPSSPAISFNDTNRVWRGVVWGCEYPDLLLTETAAFHNRRTQNLKSVTTGTNYLTFDNDTNALTVPTTGATLVTDNDENWDQRRIPQGTAMFELYATGNSNNPALPRELYTLDNTNGELYLDLERTATKSLADGSTHVYPVWRLAITESHYQQDQELPVVDEANMHLSIADRVREYPATCSLELSDAGMSVLSSTNFTGVQSAYVPVERVITFVRNPNAQLITNSKAGLTNSNNIEVYSNVNQPTDTATATYRARVLPGDYVVVGPGRDVVSGPKNLTFLGNTMPKMIVPAGATSTTMTNYTFPPSLIDMGDPTIAGRLFLHTSVNGVDEYPIRYVGANALGTLVRPTTAVPNNVLDVPNYLQIRPPVTIPCMVTKGSRRVGLNISEPLTTGADYYPDPDTNTRDQWNTALEEKDAYATVYDVPLDEDTNGSGSGEPHNPNFPHSTTEEEDRTLLNYKTIFLQRLADPTRGWDQYNNPYLTLDWMPIDLTIFNGEPHYVYLDPPTSTTWKKDITLQDHLKDRVKQKRAPDKPDYSSDIPATTIRFGSRQRGAPRTPFRGNFSFYDLWSQPDWLDTASDFDTRPPITKSVSNNPTTQGGTGSDVKVTRTTGSTTVTLTKNYYNVPSVRWQDPFDHTFGYLNLGYHTMRAPTTNTRASIPMQEQPNWVANATLLPDDVSKPWLRMSPVREPLRRPYGDAGMNSGWFTGADLGGNVRYIGSPRRPFNWLTWNNRPYAGAMELMVVPASSPSRLLHEYSMRETVAPTVPNDEEPDRLYANRYAPFSARRSANHYMPAVRVPAGTVSSGHATPNPDTNSSVYAGRFMGGFISKPPFAHLLNFFESANATGAGIAPTNGYPQQSTAANFFRLFEFVTVPSRMSGTRRPHYTSTYNNATGPQQLDEHAGYPFTAPFNLFSTYREPGKVNINTIIPLNPKLFTRAEATGNAAHYSQMVRNERIRDDGASIWRSITNDFHPTIRWLAASGTAANDFDLVDTLGYGVGGGQYRQTSKMFAFARQMNTSTFGNYSSLPRQTNARAGSMQSAGDLTFSPYMFNPSEDYEHNFYSAYASMFKDDPNSDPRGPNGVYENWTYWNAANGTIFTDDRMVQPFWNYASPAALARHDGQRPSMFNNPFRSFMEDFSASPQVPGLPSLPGANDKRFSGYVYNHPTDSTRSFANLPLLAIDSTILRRRDTTWNPWFPQWLPVNASASSLTPAATGYNSTTKTWTGEPTSPLYSPAFIEPRFDPLFALNYPRPYRQLSLTSGDMFSSSAVVGAIGLAAINPKPGWWSYAGYTSPLAEYIASPTATKPYTYGSITIDAIRVKDSDYRNTDRNPFFRYQLYTKLSNTITTRSNVYAVWVTVGYFECERVQPTEYYPVQAGHNVSQEFVAKHRFPDGYRIMRELGSDNGEATRHRAFAIIDRTIPVGFLRGENLNVDRCFLIKRIVD